MGQGHTAASLDAQAAAHPKLEGYARQARELEICDAWGVPAAVDTTAWFAVVLVVAALMAGLVALGLYAWVRGRGPLLARVALTKVMLPAVMLPAVGFAVLLGVWGWLGVLQPLARSRLCGAWIRCRATTGPRC
jgi:hypothetical protein